MAADRRPAATGYAPAWRWHFYAGLFTATFLLMLAITGALSLFNRELNDGAPAAPPPAPHTTPLPWAGARCAMPWAEAAWMGSLASDG